MEWQRDCFNLLKTSLKNQFKKSFLFSRCYDSDYGKETRFNFYSLQFRSIYAALGWAWMLDMVQVMMNYSPAPSSKEDIRKKEKKKKTDQEHIKT